MGNDRWVEWARTLQALAQTGLHFAENLYDRERYEQVGRVAAEILAEHSNLDPGEALELYKSHEGYATPRVDVRGVVFRDSKILLVREVIDKGRWTLPGGWADVNESPSEATVREVFEESGFETRAVRLLACYDRDRQGHHPPHPFHIYKLFFLCEITGGEARPSHESSEVAFFGRNEIPELSPSRTTNAEIERFFEFAAGPSRPADFD